MPSSAKILSAAAAVLIAIGLTAAPASAKVLSNMHFDESFTETVDDFCGDMHVQIVNDFRVHELVKTKGQDELAYFAANLHGSVTWTNLDTGKSFTNTFALHQMDQRVTDNGDGTLTIRAKDTGINKYFGPDGELLFIDAGQFQFQFDVDHGGTPNDPEDDVFIEGSFTLLKEAGRADTAGRDFCEDFRAITA